ncbi:MAG: Flp pilus assembly complex ATPase component TadA, partial [Fretibacterium sp.]|nr:Flp pilus assembly complex ATPase component TadA [Fretibacterium sp.]
MGTARKKIGEILLEARSITPDALEKALKAQADPAGSGGKRLGAVMVELGILTEKQVTEALGLQFMMPVVDVKDYLSNVAAINALPRSLLERLKAFPLEFQNDGRALLVAISDPLDLTTQDMLQMASNIELKFALAPADEIAEALSSDFTGSLLTSAVRRGAPPSDPFGAGGLSAGGSFLLGTGREDFTPQSLVTPKVSAVIEAPEAEAAVTSSGEVYHQTGAVTSPSSEAAPDSSGVIITGEGKSEKEDVGASIIPSFAALHAAQPKLGDLLVQAGAIQENQLMEALQLQKSSGKRLGEILVSEGIITETRVAEALSMQLRLPMFTLTRYRPMPAAIKLVPRSVAERLDLIPLSIVEGDLLLIAMANPLDLLAQDEVRMLTGRDLKIGITTLTEIRKNLDRLYNLQDNLEDAIVEVEVEGESNELDFDSGSDDAPIIQLVSNLMQQAVREGASDIHVEVYESMARVRFRVDGQLYSAFEYPVALHPAVSARLKIMAGMDIAEKRRPQDGRILIRTDGRRIDLRVSVLPTINGEKVVLRILDQESSNVGLDRLGLEADDMEKIEMFCTIPWGIMLVTGPTGSGKSTT